MKLKKLTSVLMIVSCCIVNAGGTIEENDSFDIELNDHLNLLVEEQTSNYPSYKLLRNFYDQLILEGTIKIGEGVLSYDDSSEEFKIDETLLKNVYDWAIDNELVTHSEFNILANINASNEKDIFNKDLDLGCAGAATACPFEYTVAAASTAALPCVAAAANGGANPFFDGWCATALASAGIVTYGGCGAQIYAACQQTPLPVTANTEPQSSAGPNRGVNSSGTCDDNARVNKMDFWTRKGKITKIRATCTNGSTFTVGSGNGSHKALSCDGGHMASGMIVRSGSYVDQVKLYCDEIQNIFASKHKFKGTAGGSGGSSTSTMFCAEGDGHLYGLQARESWHYRTKKRKLRYIKPTCKLLKGF